MNSLFPSLASTSVNPDRLGAVRVLIVGNAGLCCRSCSCRKLAETILVLCGSLTKVCAAGCGKTTLSHFLATGEVLLRSTPTVGCNTFVKVALPLGRLC